MAAIFLVLLIGCHDEPRPGARHAPPSPPAARTRIKICGLTREQDVDAAVAAGADAVGFVLYAPNPRALSPSRAVLVAARRPIHQNSGRCQLVGRGVDETPVAGLNR